MIVICKNKKKIVESGSHLLFGAYPRQKKAYVSFQMKWLESVFVYLYSCHSILKSCYHVKTVSSLHSLSLTLPSPLPSFLLFFLSHKPLLHTNVLQLSPEEGYVSAKEDAFLCPPHSCKEPGLPDKALFRADLALVSGNNWLIFNKSSAADLLNRLLSVCGISMCTHEHIALN